MYLLLIYVHPTKTYHYDILKLLFPQLMHTSTVFYCLALPECQQISFCQLQVSIYLGNLSNIRPPPSTSAVNYPQIILSRDTLRQPRCTLLCHIRISIIQTAGAIISWRVKPDGSKNTSLDKVIGNLKCYHVTKNPSSDHGIQTQNE